MELTYVIYFYIATVIFTYIVFRNYNMVRGSAIILSLIIGQILITILKPPQDVDSEYRNIDSAAAFYTTIQLLTPIIVYVYVIYISINDCAKK
jgi:hypothetical protein